MIVYPNCKINLGLHILRKRTDGYHDLETIFYPVRFHDLLEIIPDHRQVFDQPVSFSQSGISIEAEPAQNLCIKAYELLKKDYPALPAIRMHLHKTIPAGAGLGGGSANAAFTLLLLNTQFKLGLSDKKLEAYALQLGSDCPFFIYNKPCYATGRGEELFPVALNLSAYRLVIVNPGIHISTAAAFAGISPSLPAIPAKELILQPVESWKDRLVNDFEAGIFEKYPGIAGIKEQLYKAGAVYASMSGSGSTVYGLFKKEDSPVFQFPDTYFVKQVMA